MKERLIIVGAGGFGREVYALAHHCPDVVSRYELAGFLDDNPSALDGFDFPVGVIAGIDAYEPRPLDAFVIAVGTPALKARFATVLGEKGARFASVVHPSVLMFDNVQLGPGCIVYPHCIFTTNIRIGAHCAFYHFASLGHDVRVGDCAQLSAYCDLTGAVTAGERLFMGTHATVAPTLSLGNDVKIGAGAVVLKSLPDATTVFGNPARTI